MNFFLLDDEKIVGFIICFKEVSTYHSLNYKFFSDSEDKFLYIDRVVIKKEYRRMGAVTLLYNHLRKVANLENLPICCEVNTRPINQISLNFHSNNTYIEVEERHYDAHSVVYLKKK